MKNSADDFHHIIKEIDAMKSLTHKNIVAIEDCFQFQVPFCCFGVFYCVDAVKCVKFLVFVTVGPNTALHKNDNDTNLAQDTITITMEYCDGGTLRDLCSEVQLVEEEIAFFCSQLCEGLRFLHEKGYVHRDIKVHTLLVKLLLKSSSVITFFSTLTGQYESLILGW